MTEGAVKPLLFLWGFVMKLTSKRNTFRRQMWDRIQHDSTDQSGVYIREQIWANISDKVKHPELRHLIWKGLSR